LGIYQKEGGPAGGGFGKNILGLGNSAEIEKVKLSGGVSEKDLINNA